MENKGLNEYPPPDNDNSSFNGESEKLPSAPVYGKESEFQGATEVLEAPPAPAFVPNPEPRTLIYDPPSLVYEDIYEACIRYVKEHLCYGSRFIRQMALTEIKNDSAFHYILNSFCETRESALTCTPYIVDQYVDGPENGPPPPPWDIYVQSPGMFQDGQVKLEIPHTAYVKPCDICVGNGRIRCESCSGRGNRTCHSCGGRGRRSDRTCPFCHGRRRRRCFKCSGSGQVKCIKCDGLGNLKWYRMLIVTWGNFSDDYLANSHSLPPEYIKKVTGKQMLLETKQMLAPLLNAPDESVNVASRQMLARQHDALRNRMILSQRHTLHAVPLTKVFYQWKGKEGEFYVYGQEKKVFFHEYPQKCCCCTCL